MIELQPTTRRVIVQAPDGEVKSKGGIIIPSDARKNALWGTVLAVGPEVTDFDVGDRVFYGQYSGFEIPGDYGQKYKYAVVMNEDDILGRIIGEEEYGAA